MSGTITDYANELNDFYGKMRDLEKSTPSEFGYKLSSVLSSYHEIFSRFCPYKIGDRVQLIKPPIIEIVPGWRGSRHFLVEGAIATVRGCDWRKGQFVFDLEFDDESWIDREGKVHLIAPRQRHLFSFGEDWIAAIEQGLE